jgi:Gpi18-like mannosyltransferase
MKNKGWLNMRALGTVVAVKAVFFAFAWQAYQIIANKPVGGITAFLGMLSRWDAESFLNIAQNGYATEGKHRFLLVFLPLYPLLTKLVAIIFGNYIVSAVIVSIIASIAAALFFRMLVRLDHPERTAQAAVFFLFIFPTSLFLHIPYTEALFMALLLGSFWAARTEKWLAAGILGFLACFTRINGVVLVPALMFEVWEQYKVRREVEKRWAYLLIAPLGFIAYLAVNVYVAGEPFRFLDYQRENWYKYMRLPYYGVMEKVNTFIDQAPENANLYGLQELLFIAIGLAFIIFGWKHMRNSYRVWMVLNWLLFISTSFILSVPRYTLTLFPMFILIALAARRRPVLGTLFTVWSLMFLGLFTARFVNGGWAF